MASPQTEEGYIRIANELLEKIMLQPLTGGGLRVILAVLRKTYGFNKKEDVISLSQFQRLTGMGRGHICKEIKRLVTYKILSKDLSIYKINKNWEQWIVIHRSLVVTCRKRASDLQVTKGSDLQRPTKDNIKDTITKDMIMSKFENLMKTFPEDIQILLQDFLTLMANENKTGKVTEGKKLGAINQIYNIFLSADQKKFKEALEITVRNQAPNPNYLKAVLKGYEKKKRIFLANKALEDKKAMEEARLRSQKQIAETKKRLNAQDEVLRKNGWIK